MNHAGNGSEALTLAAIREAVAVPPEALPTGPAPGRHAAVALVLAGPEADLSLCLIRRAEAEGDPWSGHMALPGGRADPTDPTPQAVAERETWEEVGLRLHGGQMVGPLETLPVHSKGVAVGMELHPFVYYLGPHLAPFRPSEEVAEAFWVPLEHLADTRNGDQYRIVRQGVTRHSPAIRYGSDMVWGLTYRVLVTFFDRLARPLPPPW